MRGCNVPQDLCIDIRLIDAGCDNATSCLPGPAHTSPNTVLLCSRIAVMLTQSRVNNYSRIISRFPRCMKRNTSTRLILDLPTNYIALLSLHEGTIPVMNNPLPVTWLCHFIVITYWGTGRRNLSFCTMNISNITYREIIHLSEKLITSVNTVDFRL